MAISLRRYLNLHEYQAVQLLGSYGLPILRGGPVRTPEEATAFARKIAGPLVLKAQIHAGGRGRGIFKNSGLHSGVHVIEDIAKVAPLAKQMLNDYLVTKQSGKEGKLVSTLYLVEKASIKKELYLAMMIDRKKALPLLICSPKGGMGIEEIDKSFILQEYAQNMHGFSEKQLNEVAKFLELTDATQQEKIKEIIKGMFKLLIERDATLIEINPMGILADGRITVCDAKVNIDDNSKPRQPALFEMEDLTQKDPKEVEAEHNDLNYVKLNGSVGCLVNGAGLAMATMDLINFKGGEPANFLDVGGTATADRVKQAIKIINEDQDVKSILINIFGGIVRCDVVATGIINAVKDLSVKKPIVMRIKGNNSSIAEDLIKKSGLKLYWFDDPTAAAEKAISLA
jgi:succinyl-CoA synthetase beta subunit